MYSPSPFLISTAALTSIFSFFFGGYFREREKAYRLWIKYMAYESEPETGEPQLDICAELESKDRVLRQAKGILTILLLTLLGEFLIFQFYSLKYIHLDSPYYEPDAMHNYLWFTAIIGGIVLINCFEMFYIRAALSMSPRFPFLHFRKRVTGQDRLAMLWTTLQCHRRKKAAFNAIRIPTRFYDELERLRAEKEKGGAR